MTADIVPPRAGNELLVEVAIPFIQTIRRPRCRPKDVWLWKHHKVAIRIITPEEAPVAYRVTPTDDQIGDHPEYVVRGFDHRYWWPVLHWDDIPVSQAAFVRRVRRRRCDGEFLSLLNCAAPSKEEPEAVEEYFERVLVKEILGTNFDERLLLAQRGADELAFCDGLLLASAGPPVWCAVDLLSRYIGISPSSCTPDCKGNIKLPGLAVHTRRQCAAAGDVADCRESGISGHLLVRPGKVEQTVEILGPDAPPVAAEFCAREFVRLLPEAFGFWGRHGREKLRTHMPVLAASFDNGGLGEDPPYLSLLEELVSGGRSVTPFREADIDRASEILSRLKQAAAPAMAPEDDDALSWIASLDKVGE
jgi:hypothetical protein